MDGERGQAWLTVHSNGGRVDLPASVALSSPSLAVEPLSLELESENYAQTMQTIRISNRGVGTLKGKIAAQVPWLACKPETFQCATGVSTQIQVQANPEGMREGTYESVDALRIESNGGHRELSVSLILKLTPKLHLSPQVLRFGDVAEQVLQLENQGCGTLRVQVIPTEPWIAVNRQEWTIKPGKRARVKVRLVDAPQDAKGRVEIHTPDQIEHLPVQRAG